jgi:hypothetical protein
VRVLCLQLGGEMKESFFFLAPVSNPFGSEFSCIVALNNFNFLPNTFAGIQRVLPTYHQLTN